MKGQGLKKCYKCEKFTTHIAAQCPIRLARKAGQQKYVKNYRYAPYDRHNNQDSRYFNNNTSYNKNKRPYKDNDKSQGNNNKRFKTAFNVQILQNITEFLNDLTKRFKRSLERTCMIQTYLNLCGI